MSWEGILGLKKEKNISFPLRQIGKVYSAGKNQCGAVIHFGWVAGNNIGRRN